MKSTTVKKHKTSNTQQNSKKSEASEETEKRIMMNGDSDISLQISQEDVNTNEEDSITRSTESVCGTAFSKAYDELVRPYIDLIDSLRTHGLDQHIHLPAIAVIGDQSAGKSSTLEAISGVQLPRGTGIVTRCALELRLKCSSVKGPWWGNIRYKNKDGSPVDEEIDSASQVGDEVRKAQEEMTDDSKGISDGLITLDIHSPNVPDLTLIDLPGIARVAVGGQPIDIGVQIKRLISMYIERQETIILAVIPCNVDIATTEALLMAEQMDGKKERTLGVLTKPDLVDRGGEAEILKILRNESYPLHKGYTMVKCRGQLNVDNNQSLPDAMKEEEEFFKNHVLFSELPAEQCGIKSLSQKLTEELVKQIERTIPKMKEQVRQELERTHQKLKLMGRSPPITKHEKISVSLEMVRKFTEDLKNICRAEYSYVEMKNPKLKDSHEDPLRLRTSSREQFEKFGKKVKSFMPDSTDKDLRKEVKKKISDQRGREMRNFLKYSIFEEFAKDFVLKAKKPAELMLRDIVKKQHDLLELLSHQYFSSFVNFYKEMKGIIYGCMKVVTKEVENAIENLFDTELQVYSQDIPYLSNYDKIVKDRMTNEEEENPHKSKKSGLVVSFPSSFASGMDGKLPEDAEADMLLDSLQSYFQVASLRVSDYVPMIIMHNLFSKCVERLGTILHEKCVEDNIVEMVQEDTSQQKKRDALNKKVERLETADYALSKF